MFFEPFSTFFFEIFAADGGVQKSLAVLHRPLAHALPGIEANVPCSHHADRHRGRLRSAKRSVEASVEAVILCVLSRDEDVLGNGKKGRTGSE